MNNQKIQFAAIQMNWSIDDYKNEKAFEKKIESLMDIYKQKAAPNIPSLVVFPENVGAPLVFMGYKKMLDKNISIKKAINRLIMSNLPKVIMIRLRYRVGWMRALMLLKAEEVGRFYIRIFSRMAKKYGVYLIAGSALLPDFKIDRDIEKVDYCIYAGSIYNISYFFDPDGHIIGTQKKVYLVPGLEDSKGFDLSHGKLDELKVFDTELGRVGIAICLDGFKDSVIERLKGLDSDIIVQPSANCKIWDESEQRGWTESCWRTMYNHKNFKYAINPMMTGNLFDLDFQGQTSILSNVDNLETQYGYKDLKPMCGFVSVSEDSCKDDVLVYSTG